MATQPLAKVLVKAALRVSLGPLWLQGWCNLLVLNSAGADHARADLESINVLLVAPFAGHTQTSKAFPVLRAVASRFVQGSGILFSISSQFSPPPCPPPDANALHI